MTPNNGTGQPRSQANKPKKKLQPFTRSSDLRKPHGAWGRGPVLNAVRMGEWLPHGGFGGEVTVLSSFKNTGDMDEHRAEKGTVTVHSLWSSQGSSCGPGPQRGHLPHLLGVDKSAASVGDKTAEEGPHSALTVVGCQVGARHVLAT